MRFRRHRVRRTPLQKRRSEGRECKAYTSWWPSVVAAGLTALISLVGIAWQLNEQSRQFEKARLLDGAQNTAQETSHLLSDGYNALVKLSRDSHRKTWEEINRGPWREFMGFHRRWRQQLIAHHFQVVRYFGKDLADELIHVDEIDLDPAAADLGSLDPCSSYGASDSPDIEKLARLAECRLRMAAVTRSANDFAMSKGDMSGFIDDMQAYDGLVREADRLIEEYDKSTVRFLRTMQSRLIQFQGGPYVIVTSS